MLPTPVEHFKKTTMVSSSPILLSTRQTTADKLLLDAANSKGLVSRLTTATYPPCRQLLTEDERKEQFQMFLGILIKYLGKKDPELQTRAKEVIQECQAAYNKSGIKSNNGIVLYLRIQSRLQEIVTVKQWKRAQMYLQMHLKNKQERADKMQVATAMPLK